MTLSLRTVGMEVSALGALALSMPLRWLVRRNAFDRHAPYPTPIVLVHGFLGHETNFLMLRGYLASRGIPNGFAFSYPAPRFDYPRLACGLERAIDAVRDATGEAAVDVVGHSLGGLVGRYLVEMRPGAPIRRLITLGAPYFANPLPGNELAVFGAGDPFVAQPHPRYGPQLGVGRVILVADCGHWGLLYHPGALAAVAEFLRRPEVAVDAPLALDAAS